MGTPWGRTGSDVTARFKRGDLSPPAVPPWSPPMSPNCPHHTHSSRGCQPHPCPLPCPHHGLQALPGFFFFCSPTPGFGILSSQTFPGQDFLPWKGPAAHPELGQGCPRDKNQLGKQENPPRAGWKPGWILGIGSRPVLLLPKIPAVGIQLRGSSCKPLWGSGFGKMGGETPGKICWDGIWGNLLFPEGWICRIWG